MRKELGNKLVRNKLLIPLLLLVLIVVIGTSYALWQLTFRQTGTNIITTGCFKVEFNDKDPISLTDAYPLTSTEGKTLAPYEFTLTNICEKEVDYYINLETLATDNNLAEEYLRANLTTGNKDIFSDTLKNEYVNKERVITDSTRAFMLSSGSLLEKESKTFELRLWLDADTPLNADTMNRTYQGKVTVTTTYVPDLVVRNMMIPMDITYDSYKFPTKNNTYTQNDKYKLSKVSFEKTITNYENVEEVVDFSVDGDKSVQGYYVKDNPDLEDSEYTLHIQANGKIQTNPNAIAFFSMIEDSTTSFEGIENIDTSFAEDMSYMFYKYKGETLDLSGFNTRNATNMLNMFRDCKNITSLNLSGFNTSNVVDMGGMFNGCSNLTSLDLSKFDTSKVINMITMFYNCCNLSGLNLSNFDTSSVTTMEMMFYACKQLTVLDLSGFDTSKVTNMSSMFLGCNSLTSLDLSMFNTSNATNMESMFYNCTNLVELDLNNFDTSKVVDMRNMFSGCYNLANLNVSSFNTTSVTNMAYMFRDCRMLTNLDLSNLDTSKVTDMDSMFQKCWNLTTMITIRNSQTSSTRTMFENSAIEEPARITVNYTSATSDLVDQMIATKSANSNVVKGELVD